MTVRVTTWLSVLLLSGLVAALHPLTGGAVFMAGLAWLIAAEIDRVYRCLLRIERRLSGDSE